MINYVNVLQITVGGNEYTGVASFMLQYYTRIDKTKIHYDFCFCRENSMALQKDNPVLLESKIFELKAIKNNGAMDYKGLFIKLFDILKNNSYDIVHINTSAIITTFICLLVAKLAKVKTVIAHSHNDGVGRSQKQDKKLTKVIKDLCRKYVVNKSDYLFACSLNAGKFLFGDAVKLKKFCVIKNAIDTERYVFDEKLHKKIRDEERIEKDWVVIGHVGRISPPKNHWFIIDVFKAFHHICPNSVLWLVGDGEDKDKLIKYIQKNDLDLYVKIWGERKDVPYIMQGMDIFIFPSQWEGFGLVAVEAEASGLPVFASDKVPNEVDVTDLVKHIPLTNSPAEWADIMWEGYKNLLPRCNTSLQIIQGGYDIAEAVLWLQNFYISCKYDVK